MWEGVGGCRNITACRELSCILIKLNNKLVAVLNKPFDARVIQKGKCPLFLMHMVYTATPIHEWSGRTVSVV